MARAGGFLLLGVVLVATCGGVKAHAARALGVDIKALIKLLSE